MTICYFDKEQHYKQLSNWWVAHGHGKIEASSLPIGVVVSDASNKLLAMSFIYMMDGTDVAQLAWTTTNPENSNKESYKAVDLAIDALLIVAQKFEKKTILCFSSSKGLTKILNKKNIQENKNHVLSIGGF
jgi:hypothetical protein